MLKCRRFVAIYGKELVTRKFHSSARSSSETITVPCQSNGTITLDIHHPLKPPHSDLVIPYVAIYLPRGPLLSNIAHDATNVSILRSILPCHVVQINYRCNKAHPFPTPLHDVMFGYDWIKANLLAKRAIVRPGRSDQVGRIAIAGELIGGQLALALALSECRLGEPGIIAAAVNNPIVDWTALDEHKVDTSDDVPHSSLSIGTLLQQRKMLFGRPDAYFDPFASPALFFRSSGFEIPPREPEEISSDMDELAALEREDFFRQQLALSAVAGFSSANGFVSGNTSPIKKRKASRRFPSPALKLRLPQFCISTGLESSITKQASELAQLLEKSFERESKNVVAQARAERMVEYVERAGLALWDDSHSGRLSMFETAHWLENALSRGIGLHS